MISEMIGTASVLGKLGLLVAVATVLVAAAYAIRPNERRLAAMRPLSLATIFAALCSFTTGIAVILQGISASGDLQKIGWHNVYAGAAESILPLVGAFGCLTIAWIGVAVGMRRTA